MLPCLEKTIDELNKMLNSRDNTAHDQGIYRRYLCGEIPL